MISPETLARIDPYARKVGQYTAYTLTEQEYIGKVYAPHEWSVEGYLLDNGYTDVWFEAAKMHPQTGAVHDLAMRKVHGMMDSTPEKARGTGVVDGYHNEQRQWHVHGFQVGDYLHLYEHYELRGDPWPIGQESVRGAYERAKTHYRPTYDREERDKSEWTYIRGAASDATQRLVG